MQPYTENLREIATYWPPVGNDGYGGRTYGTPRSVLVRWQNTAELFRDAQGNEVTSSAVVYPAEELAIGGQILRGTSAEEVPASVGAREIRQVGDSPSLDQQRVLHKVFL